MSPIVEPVDSGMNTKQVSQDKYLPIEAQSSEGRTLVYHVETILLMVVWLMQQVLLLLCVSLSNLGYTSLDITGCFWGKHGC